MRYLFFCLSLVVTFFGVMRIAGAAESACSKLDDSQKQVATAILQSQHAYDCCDRSLSECLKRKPVCRLVRRLSEDVCRRVAAGQSRADIERELARRATSMTPTGNTFRIDTKGATALGKTDAKVEVVTYICPRCPFCAQLMTKLDESIESGKLAGKVKLYARLFPVRSHTGSTEAGIALIAAETLGKFWPLLMRLYREFDQFDPTRLVEMAGASGMDQKRFSELTNDPRTRERLVEVKKEGVRNGVESTPTFFIDRRKYTGQLDLSTLEDVLEEEYDRVTGKQYE